MLLPLRFQGDHHVAKRVAVLFQAWDDYMASPQYAITLDAKFQISLSDRGEIQALLI